MKAWELSSGAVIAIGADKEGRDIEATVTHVVPCMLHGGPMAMVSSLEFYFPILIDANANVTIRND